MRRALASIGIGTFLMCNTSSALAAVFTVGTAAIFNNSTNYIQAVATIDSTHVFIAYNENGAGKAVIGTISGTDISYGTAYTFDASGVQGIDVSLLDSTHAVIAYEDIADGKAIVAVISGTDISFGSAQTFDSTVGNGGEYTSTQVAALDSSHFVVTIQQETAGVFPNPSTYAQSIIAGTVSGTDITFGSSYQLQNSYSPYASVTKLDATHFVTTYDEPTGEGHAIVGVVSGTSITFGSAVQYTSSSYNTQIVAISDTQVVLAYRTDGSHPISSIVGTVSGTSISFDSATQVVAVGTNDLSLVKIDATHVALAYVSSGYIEELTISGTSVSGDTAVQFSNLSLSDNPDTAMLDASTVAIVYSTGSKGYGIVATLPSATPYVGGGAGNRLRRKRNLEMFATAASEQSSRQEPTLKEVGIIDPDTVTYNAPTQRTTKSAVPTVPTRRTLRVHMALAQQETPAATHAAAEHSPLQRRTCSRVWNRFSDASLERVNERLMQRLGFTCEK